VGQGKGRGTLALTFTCSSIPPFSPPPSLLPIIDCVGSGSVGSGSVGSGSVGSGSVGSGSVGSGSVGSALRDQQT
jgi:hypothetical protein